MAPAECLSAAPLRCKRSTSCKRPRRTAGCLMVNGRAGHHVPILLTLCAQLAGSSLLAFVFAQAILRRFAMQCRSWR